MSVTQSVCPDSVKSASDKNNKVIMMNTLNQSRYVKSMLALSAVCGASLYTQSAEAAIYTYVDKEGTRWLTNTPKKGGKYKLVAKYGAPQKKSKTIRSTAQLPSSAGVNLPSVSRSHCGGQSQAQLDNKFSRHEDHVRTYARAYGVDENLVRAVMKQESCFNPNAKSRAGAMGLMQLMPGTADMMGVGNAWEPEQNIRGGVKYLAQMLREFGGDKRLALAAYNAGPGAVRKYNGIPPYRETRTYVARIMAEYDHLSNRQVLAGNGGFQRNARVTTAAVRGYGWAKPVQEFTVFRGLDPT